MDWRVIQAAAASPLGIVALIVLVLSTLATVFFRGSSVSVKIWVFALMFGAAAALVIAVMRQSPSPPAKQSTSAASPSPGSGANRHGGSSIAGKNPSGQCLIGYVWREAFAGDHVCVTPRSQQRARDDNAAAASLRAPNSDSCLVGYVWRQANPSDHVCVTPATRGETAEENQLASGRSN